jgi:hypothetical protein
VNHDFKVYGGFKHRFCNSIALFFFESLEISDLILEVSELRIQEDTQLEIPSKYLTQNLLKMQPIRSDFGDMTRVKTHEVRCYTP